MDAIIARLRESEAELVAVVSGLTDVQWSGSAVEGRWSGREIVEHLILVERARGGDDGAAGRWAAGGGGVDG